MKIKGSCISPCSKFLIICLFVVFKEWILSTVEANLLQFSPKSTSRPRFGAVRTLLPFVPNTNNKRKSFVVRDFADVHFYVQFIVAYSNSKKWSSAQLLFPRPDPDLCRYFQISLLREASLTTTCQDSLSMTLDDIQFEKTTIDPRGFWHFWQQTKLSGRKGESNFKLNNTQKFISPTTHLTNEPLIACHFLVTVSGNETRTINVNPRLLIDYSAKMEVLVIGASYAGTEKIIDELQPEINTNYKWTFASRMNETHVNIEDIFGVATSSVPLRNPFASWSHRTGLSIDYRKLNGPSNFQGRVIRVTTVEGQPFVYLHESQQGKFEATGYLPDILRSISSQLNFKFELFPPADKSFGSADDQGNFSGMVGQLQRKEVDIALMSFSYTEDRRKVMSFSPPVEYSATRLLVRKDRQTDEVNWLAYLDPFEWKVWIAIPFTISLGVLTFFAFSYFKVMDSTPGQSAWLLSLCILQQGQDEHTMVSVFPGRIVLGSFWILAVVLYSTYTAKITSSLATVTEELPLHSLAEAVSQQNWKIGLVKGSSVPDRVRGSEMPEMKIMWKKIQRDSTSLVSGFKEGIDRAYNERMAFFTSDLIPSFLIKDNCSFIWVPGKFFRGFGYMGYQKDLPYAAIISNEVAKLRQSGQMKRLFRKWWGTENSCAKTTNNGFVGMSLYKTGTAFLVLIIGAMFAFILVLVEFCVHLKKLPDETKTNEEQSLPPQFSASTNSSQFSRKELMGVVNESSKSNTPYRPNIHKHNSSKGFFLQLATPFHYFLYPQRNSSMPKKWNNTEKPANTWNLNF